jgi:hypothetical protein
MVRLWMSAAAETDRRSAGGPITGRRTVTCHSDDESGRCPGSGMKTLQKFASVHVNVHNHFSLERHLVDRPTYRERRSAALAEWQILAS